ncbi:MAG: hypothetical protein IKK08_00075 [Clostridia bacterium]|nr:hypothetical protein [Clostridia bacterium]
MKYEIVYISTSGCTKKVAQALAEAVSPQPCRLINFEMETPSDDADVYLVGFCVRHGACPYALLEWMETLEDKKVMLFATGGLAAVDGYQKRIEAVAASFLSDSCEYLGMHLCQGEISPEGYTHFRSCLSDSGDEGALQNIRQLYAYSQGHPNTQELQDACNFMKNALKQH